MKTKNFIYLLLFATMIVVVSCTRDQAIQDQAAVSTSEELQWNPADGIAKYIPKEYKDNIRAEDITRIEKLLRNPKEEVLTSRGNEIHLAAGSTNKLAAAIAAASSGDVIVLDQGDHFESGTITIDKSINIIGYNANYISSGIKSVPDHNFKSAIHITTKGSISSIRGITFKSTETHPGLCIYIDHTIDISVVYNTFENWQYGIVSNASDYGTFVSNTIHCDPSWTAGIISDADGIIFADGHHNQVFKNEVTGGFFAIWTGGSQGICFANNTHHGFLGLILCKVPPGSFQVDGASINTAGSSISWLCTRNVSTDNFLTGYLVIDGSYNNLLQQNKSKNNTNYDYYLVGDSHIFGFFTPKAYNNTVIATSSQIIKDCAENSTIIGGVRVNTSTDPCN